MKQIGTRLKIVRKLLNKSQDELASELDVTKQAISNIENQKSTPSIPLLYKLNTAFNINLNYLISGNGEIILEGENSQKTLKKALIKEVELYLNSRGIC